MIIETETDDGGHLRLDCPDTLASRWTCEAILRGRTYPDVPFLGDVGTIVDAGANVGSATVYFAHHHPDASIHAVEPGAEALAFLERNVRALPNVTVHPIGLADADGAAQLHHADGDIGQASIHHHADAASSEAITVRAAGAWAAEHGISQIDILKVDVEGCEVQVLESLGPLASRAKAVYVEYDDRAARRRVDAILAPTHELYLGSVFLDQGECLYVRADLVADTERAHEHLRAVLADRFRAQAGQ